VALAPSTPGPAGPSGRGHHDWHSPQYVRQWVEDNEARLAERSRQFDLLADFIPYPGEAPLRLLDLGAGWGPVTRHLLARFPQASATLLDYSEAMLAEAREHLAPLGQRVRYVSGDLSQPGAVGAAVAAGGGPFHAIVSSSCIHNLRPTERIPALYRELRQAAAPGGCFLNLDLVGTAAGPLQGVWHRARVEQLRRRRLTETGRLPTYAEAEAELQTQGRRAAAGGTPQPPEGTGGAGRSGGAGSEGGGTAQPASAGSGGVSRSLQDHLSWLWQAGFDAVECFWRQDARALIGGYVAP
jgi:cyclopropane fatty-acyl-phospholipid synthase-like methyltransferase